MESTVVGLSDMIIGALRFRGEGDFSEGGGSHVVFVHTYTDHEKRVWEANRWP